LKKRRKTKILDGRTFFVLGAGRPFTQITQKKYCFFINFLLIFFLFKFGETATNQNMYVKKGKLCQKRNLDSIVFLQKREIQKKEK